MLIDEVRAFTVALSDNTHGFDHVSLSSHNQLGFSRLLSFRLNLVTLFNLDNTLIGFHDVHIVYICVQISKLVELKFGVFGEIVVTEMNGKKGC